MLRVEVCLVVGFVVSVSFVRLYCEILLKILRLVCGILRFLKKIVMRFCW